MNGNGKKALGIYLDEIGKGERMSDEQERALAARIASGDDAAVGELTAANLKFVVRMCREYQGKGLTTEDLIGEGNIGLMRAARKYAPDCKKRFVVFAAPYVREAMEKAIAKDGDQGTASEGQRAKDDLRRTDEARLADLDATLADEATDSKAAMERIVKAMETLDERQRRVISCYYGIGRPSMTMAEIAVEMGVTRERVRQIRDKGKRKMKARMKDKVES